MINFLRFFLPATLLHLEELFQIQEVDLFVKIKNLYQIFLTKLEETKGYVLDRVTFEQPAMKFIYVLGKNIW